MTRNSRVTLDETCDSPLMLKETVWFSGKKMVWKTVADTAELSMQGLRDLDSITRVACTISKRLRPSVAVSVCSNLIMPVVASLVCDMYSKSRNDSNSTER
jgi:hypothetical protein